MQKIKLQECVESVNDHWSPVVVAELNRQQVKVAKLLGEFHWHKHDAEDELFYVLEGTLKMMLRDKTIVIEKGEMLVVPKGVEHKPVADEEVTIMLFEPASTIKNGD